MPIIPTHFIRLFKSQSLYQFKHTFFPSIYTRYQLYSTSEALELNLQPIFINSIEKTEMNVTRHNFEECYSYIEQDIMQSTARFIAIDTEFTGLSRTDQIREEYLDTLEERYEKLRQTGQNFLITQFGLSIIHVHPEAINNTPYHVKTWNFYIFPRPFGSIDHRFLCQSSSLQFLSDHGFNFNKWIADGIPFLQLAQVETLRKRMEKRIKNLEKDGNQDTNGPILSEDGKIFQHKVMKQLEDWLQQRKLMKNLIPPLVITTKNSFYRMIVHETIRQANKKHKHLYTETCEDTVVTTWLSKKAQKAKREEKVALMRQELVQATGFTRIIELLKDAKKPIIGHNAMLDFLYIFEQFYAPLPPTLLEYKQQMAELFPIVLDTKRIARQLYTSNGPLNTGTGLSTLFHALQEKENMPSAIDIASSAPEFSGYRNVLLHEASSTQEKDDEKEDVTAVEQDKSSSLLAHEAGFDALMTSVCLVGLLYKMKKVDNDIEMNIKELVDSFQNQLNLMTSDYTAVELSNPIQNIDRSNVYHVSCNGTNHKRRFNHIRLESLFPGVEVVRVLRETDRRGFVILSEKPQHIETPPTDVEIVSYDIYKSNIQSREKKPQIESSQTQYKEIEQVIGTLQIVEPESTTLWGRCIIM